MEETFGVKKHTNKMAIIFGVIFFLSHCISVTLTARAQDNFYFDPAPVDETATEGTSTLLRCDVSNRKHIAFYWELDARPVTNTSRRYQDDSDLRITRVDKNKDSGSFRCIATNVTTGVSLRSTEAKLNILWLAESADIQLKHPKSTSAIVEGANVNLKCNADGNPEPSVEWFKNKLRLSATDDVRIHGSKLRIVNVTSEHNGMYACSARNGAGDVTSNNDFLLNVEGRESAHLDESRFTRKLLVRRGSRAQFDCVFSNSLRIEWYKGNKRLKNKPNEVEVHSNGSMVLQGVGPTDAGSYKCVGVSDKGPDQVFTSQLLLAYLDDMGLSSFEPQLERNHPQVVPQGKDLQVQCLPPAGMPQPTVRWLDPYDTEVPEVGRVKADDELRMSVTNAQPEDTGNYSCQATNMAATKRAQVWIVVSAPPRITRPPLSIRRQEGETAEFDCLMSGTPFPVTTINWVKEGKPIDLQHPRFVVNAALGTLRIIDVHLLDEGNYACVVNTTGQKAVTSTNAHLYVKKTLKFRPPPVNTKLELGSNSKVFCNAEGQTEPSVKWMREDKQPFPDHIYDNNGWLMFDGVTRDDIGSYTCIATNEQGTIDVTIYVDVVVKPQFKVKPKNTTAFEGYPVTLHCVAVGDPIPTIQWDKNNKYINPTNYSRFTIWKNGTLQISEVYMEDMGRYGCTAGNSGGFQREEILLHVQSSENYHITKRRDDDNFPLIKTIIIAVCSAVAYLAVVIGLTVYCSIRLVKAKNMRKQYVDMAPVIANGGPKHENGVLPNERTELMERGRDRDSSIVKSDDARSHASGVSSHQSHNSSHPSSGLHSNPLMQSRGAPGVPPRGSYDKLNFPRHDLQTLGMLGKGHYGDVFLAKAHGIKEGQLETLVVVKSLLSRDETHLFNFRREIDMYSKLNHENIARLLGVCREMEPQFIITEYCEWGDLKQFLWATRHDNIKRNPNLPPLTLAQKTSMINQVALAMEYMSSLRVVHRDLAARNILLTPMLDLKVSNLALCRDVYASEYYPYHRGGAPPVPPPPASPSSGGVTNHHHHPGATLIPLRWMPPEGVLEQEYSTKSDVWSFGVFAWEVFTLADMPYTMLTDEAVLKGLRVGDLRLDRPAMPGVMPPPIQRLIDMCTEEGPQHRPSFSEIVLSIAELTVDSDV